MTDPVAGNGTGEVRGVLNSGAACPWQIPPPVLFDFRSTDAAAKVRRELEREFYWSVRIARPPTKLIITDIA